MKLVIITISLLLFFWSTNVESLKIKEDRNYQATDTELEKNRNEDFNGLWVNEAGAKARIFITQCKISFDKNSLVVRMWGACHPEDCDWGENVLRDLKKGSNKFELLWDQELAESTITYEIIDGKLKMTHNRRYKDNSGRPDFTLIEYFIKK